MSDTLEHTKQPYAAERAAARPPSQAPAESRRRRLPEHLGVHAVLLLGSIVMLGPFFWEVSTSLKTLGETLVLPPTLLPEEPQWSNYGDVFDTLPFAQMFANSVLLTAGRVLGQLVLCSMAGYAFARFEFRGRGLLFGLFLSVLMVPSQLFLLPQYEIIASLGWLNTLQALIVPGLFSAFGTFLMRQFFLSLPRELEEAAKLDGANHWQIFTRIMLPLAKPGLIALTVLDVLWSWNDLMWPLVVNNDPTAMPLSVGLASLIGQYQVNTTTLMAGSVLATMPVLVMFIMLQRQFIQGIAFSGSKG